MTTMKVALPNSLTSFVDDQVTTRGYASSSEHVRDLIHKDRDRQRLRGLLLEGVESPPAVAADGDYFDRLRSRIHEIDEK